MGKGIYIRTPETLATLRASVQASNALRKGIGKEIVGGESLETLQFIKEYHDGKHDNLKPTRDGELYYEMQQHEQSNMEFMKQLYGKS